MSRAGLTPDVITLEAAGLADADGLRQVSLSAVAARLGVRAPSLYSHVAGAEDLHGRLTLLALTDLADRGDTALAGLSGQDALRALATVYRRYAQEHPGRFEAAGNLDLPPSPALAKAGERLAQQSLAVLRGYAVPEAERTHAVRVMSSLLRGFVQLEAGGAFAHSVPPSDESWDRALDVLDATLRGWAR